MKKTIVTDNISYIEPVSMSNYQACSGLVVTDKGTKLVIDTNLGRTESKPFLALERPDIGIVSHYHLDHAVWSSELMGTTDAELFVPEIEARYLSDFDFYLKRTIDGSPLTALWKHFTLSVAGYKELGHYSVYGEGHCFDIGRCRIECIGTPGHSPGHMSFYFPFERILFTGDMGVDRFGPWYGWPDCDLVKMIDAMFRLRAMPVTTLLTSHGGLFTTGIVERWDRALGHLMDREKRIVKGLEEGLEKERIVASGIFFKRMPVVDEPMRSFFRMWDENMYDHHLALIERGGIAKVFSMSRRICRYR
ncbi:MAG: MBL fold metallo-hydrolase [Desulfobacteraceae bacterium]|nr:MBL fold metallo-hydrolase [Desulfobacteraceae bacterium]